MRMSDLEGRSMRVAQDGSVEVQGPDGQWRVLGMLGLDGVIREPEGITVNPEAFQGEPLPSPERTTTSAEEMDALPEDEPGH